MIVTEDRKYIKDITYENAEDFLKAVSYGGELYFMQQPYYIFRGHERINTNYSLQLFATICFWMSSVPMILTIRPLH